MKKRQPCIYKITNIVDGKVYIGQTNVNFENREYAHRYELSKGIHKNTHLQSAANKYGLENFVFEKIQECDTEELDALETLWINLFNSTNRSNGYNFEGGGSKNKTAHDETRRKLSLKGKAFSKTSKGRALIRKRAQAAAGHKNYNAKKVICINDKKVFGCIRYASEYYNVNRSDVSAVCRGLRISVSDLQFAYFEEGKIYELKERKSTAGKDNHNARKVICIDTGEIFNTMTEAAQKFGLNMKNICQVCRGDKLSTGGLQFAYFEEHKEYKLKELPVHEKGNHPCARKIICINDKKIFSSVIEASEYYGITYQNLHQVVLGKNKATQSEDGKWLQFAYYEEGKTYKLKAIDESKIKKPKKVICLTTNQVFESTNQAAEIMGVNQSKISMVCNGKRSYTGKLPDGTKLKWAFHEEHLSN